MDWITPEVSITFTCKYKDSYICKVIEYYFVHFSFLKKKFANIM